MSKMHYFSNKFSNSPTKIAGGSQRSLIFDFDDLTTEVR